MCAILISKALRYGTYYKEGSHSFTCHPTRLSTCGMSRPVFTFRLQSITALWPVLISCPAKGRRLSCRLLGGWLHIEVAYNKADGEDGATADETGV